MGFSDDLPFWQQQGMDNQAMSWIPDTPAKPIPRKRRSGPSAHRGREFGGASAGFHGNETSRGLVDQLRDPSCCGTAIMASESLHTHGYSNAGMQPQAAVNSMEQWANTSYRSLLATADATAASKMTAFTPLMMSQIRNGQAMAAAQNPLLLKGKNLLPKSPMGGSNNNLCRISPYEFPNSLLLNLNSLPEKTAPTSMSGVSCSPSTPGTLDKGKRIQDFSPRGIDDLVGIAETGGNIRGNKIRMPQTVADANEPAGLFSPNPIISSQLASSQREERGVSLGIPAGATEEEHQGIDLNKTPQPKPRRKKHRPKVVREGKPSRTPKPATPKPVTPKPTKKDEKPSGKRKYVRKNKASNFADAPCQSSHVVDLASGSGIKTARRCLNFDSEETQARNGCQGSSMMFEPNSEGHAQDKFISAIGTSSVAQSAVPSVQGREMLLENSQARIMFDLSSSANQMHDEHIRSPETPNPPYRPSRRETVRVNNMASGFIRVAKLPTSSPQSSRRVILVENLKKLTKESEVLNSAGGFGKLKEADQGKSVPSRNASVVLLRGVKRHHSLVNDSSITRNINFMHASNMTDGGHGFCSPESRKKIRADGGQNELAGSSSSLTLTPLNGWKMGLIVPRSCQMFTLADAQRLVAFKKQQDSYGMLFLDQGETKAKNGPELPIEGGGSTSLVAPIEGGGSTSSVVAIEAGKSTSPSINQVSSPEKVNGCSNPQDIQTCVSREDHVKMKMRRRSKREKSHFVRAGSSNTNLMCLQENATQSCGGIMSCHQISDKVTALASNISCENSNHQVALQEYQARQSFKGSHPGTSTSGVIVQSWDPLDDIVQMMRCLHISGDHGTAVDKAHNTLVPYGGGGGVVVPYDLPKKRRLRPKVDLDSETERVWKLLMGKETSYEGPNEDKEKWWEKERHIFAGRVNSFIARMHLVQGDRRFSKWKGSVVDSVVGVFLTQNVSDHLSSSAFMSLAARFPLRSKGDNNNSNEELGIPKEHVPCNVPFDVSVKWQDNMLGQELYDRDSFGKAEHMTEVTNSNSSPGSNTGSSTVDCSNVKSLDVHETEVEICHEQPDSRTSTPVTVTGSTSVTEVDDRSMEDVVSSHNSVVSPQDPLDYTVQLSDINKLNLLSKFDADDLLYGGMSSGLDSSTSFMELLHMAETTRFKELYNHENGRIVSTEYCGEVDQLASLEVSKNTSISGIPNYADGECPSVHMLNSHPCNAPNDFMSVPYAPYRLYNSLNANAIREDTCPGLHLKASGMKTTNNIDTTCIRSGPLAENSTDAMGQCLPSSLYRMRPVVDTYARISKHFGQSSTCLESEVYIDKHSSCHGNLTKENNEASLDNNTRNRSSILQDELTAEFQQRERGVDFQVESIEHAVGAQSETQDCRVHQSYLNSDSKLRATPEVVEAVESNLKVETFSSQNVSVTTTNRTSKVNKSKTDTEKKKIYDWDNLRKMTCQDGATKGRSTDTMDSLDWEAVRCADVSEISKTIRERGMNNMLSERIQEFLNRVVKDHGSIDLEWLRDVPPDSVKDYLLSIRGLGLKSVECVRLLTLHHLAFPVDTNVGRICVRLGWVPLQPLPESLQLHLLEMYPVLETIQKYIWPRLCKLDQRTLYELHYQMITFGKVFCTKSKPNCNACPMRGECKHFASAYASARFALPGPEEKGIVMSTVPNPIETDQTPVYNTMCLPQLENTASSREGTGCNNCEPIVEEPATPEPESVDNQGSNDIEDAFVEDPEEIPHIKLNLEALTQNVQDFVQANHMELQDGDVSNALVALAREVASIPMPKLKNVGRLRTEHQVYELPDSHELLRGLKTREPDDPCSYLLAIWSPGETSQSTEAPTICCNSQVTGKLCDEQTCFACNSTRESQAQIVRGTLLIPCRTAMRGSFPLNGTYFQVNEVFADHDSSHNPIAVSRQSIWNLPRRTVYFGTSVTTIFKGLTTEGIQYCFWRGFVCVRGFDRITRAPRPLCARLHIAASRATRDRKARVAEAAAAAAAAARKEEQAISNTGDNLNGNLSRGQSMPN